MTDSECMELLGQKRPELLVQYHDALRYALINADFLRSTDFQVMQAYTMFLLAVRVTYDPDLLWILTGVALRMAQRMGLHRDGELIGLNPFDTELRRRVFWKLPQLDGFASQLCGTANTIESINWSTKQALNVNDKDIWPGMESAPKEQNGATDMIFCLTRAELGNFYGRTNLQLGALAQAANQNDLRLIAEAEKQIDDLENTIEMKFLRYCDPVDTLHVLTAIIARAAIKTSRLRVRLPRAKAGMLSSNEREQTYKLALQVVDHTIAAHTNPTLTKFLWHTSGFLIWDILIWILYELRQGSPTVAKLALKTWDSLLAQEKTHTSEPPFISTVRSAIEERSASRPSDKTSKTTGYEDIAASDDLPAGLQFPPDIGTVVENEIDADTFDWTFWDQFVRDQEQSQLRPP
ncbi:hypothetical protein MBLNU459_g6878t2 [Dothideomycetes sp. NU459]